MHPKLILIAAMVAWALCATPWRKGSAFLAAEWIIGQAWWVKTGDDMPTYLYCVLDPIVAFAVIKWRTTWQDWAIVALFPIAWICYALPQNESTWSALYLIMAAQLTLAGPWLKFQRADALNSHGPLRAGDDT